LRNHAEVKSFNFKRAAGELAIRAETFAASRQRRL